MGITKLSVPFHQKDQAKELGAKWNAQEKVWYITEKEDPSLFLQWLQNENSAINLRANSYYIARSLRTCWQCEHNSQVYAIILPKKSLYSKEYATILSYLQYINKGMQKRFEALTSHYYYDYSRTTSGSYWMNHCEICRAKFGDFETIEEYTSPFRPTSVDEAKNISLYYSESPLEAFGSNCKSVAFLACMKIMPDPLAHDDEKQDGSATPETVSS